MKQFSKCTYVMFLFSFFLSNPFIRADDKAPRPTYSNPIVGPLVPCNLNGVILLLNQLKNILINCCNNTNACAATIINSPTTITNPGYYCLSNDIIGSIIINANDVTLDLNNHTITGLGAGSGNGITVNNGNNRVIKNGRILNFDTGIQGTQNHNTNITNVVMSSCFVEGITINDSTEIYLEMILTTSIGTNGVHFIGNNDNCTIKNVNVTGAQQGFIFENVSNSIIKDCNVVDCSSDFEPIFPPMVSINAFQWSGGCNNITIENCSAKNFIALDFPVGFIFDGAENIILRSCAAQNIIQTSPTGAYAAGFLCTEFTTANIQFFDCSVETVTGQGFIAGFEIDGQSISLSNCVTQNCIASAQGNGFFTSGLAVSFNNCLASSCSHFGFATNTPSSRTADIVYSNCQSIDNSIGFLILVPNILLSHCIAFNNTIGFDLNVAGIAIVNCFASQNTTNYTGAGAINVQNANTQVTPGNPLANGPFAGGNLFI